MKTSPDAQMQPGSEPCSESGDAGLGDPQNSETEVSATDVQNPTPADGDAYWFSGDPKLLLDEIWSLGDRVEDLDYAARTLARLYDSDSSTRYSVVWAAEKVAARLGIVDQFREILRKALSDKSEILRNAGRYFERKAEYFYPPEDLAMKKRLSGMEFQMWLIRNDPEATENYWKYRRIEAEERKQKYAQMTRTERKQYRQRFIRNDSRIRKAVGHGPDREQRKSRLQKSIFENVENRQRRAWVPRWLP